MGEGSTGARRVGIRRERHLAAGRGSDRLYAGWYQEMLGITYPDLFPIAYDEDDPPDNAMATVGGRKGILLPLPPPGEGALDRMSM